MRAWLKSVLFLLLLSILHFGYDATGWAFLKPFCGTNESVFQHLKMGFWAYLLLLAIEYLVLYRGRGTTSSFVLSGVLVAVMVPWVVVLVWYLAPALYGKPLPLALELIWAAFATLLAGFIAAILHGSLRRAHFSGRAVLALLLLAGLSVFFFTWFTYHSPWIDLFQIPG
ncbi:hypothetical protein HPY42_01440 [Coprothermobacteraceae bacterium]|nr:hypothetical protein [Coprothermobacteraceae bacterium]